MDYFLQVPSALTQTKLIHPKDEDSTFLRNVEN